MLPGYCGGVCLATITFTRGRRVGCQAIGSRQDDGLDSFGSEDNCTATGQQPVDHKNYRKEA